MKAKETLERVRTESDNLGVTVYQDFIYLCHNDYRVHNDFGFKIDFEHYGFIEFCLFADCLKLFEDHGYDSLTQIIDEIELEHEEKREQ